MFADRSAAHRELVFVPRTVVKIFSVNLFIYLFTYFVRLIFLFRPVSRNIWTSRQLYDNISGRRAYSVNIYDHFFN